MVQLSGTLPDSQQTPRIGLIAHDMKKDVLIDVLREFVPRLHRCHIVSTRGTGQLCASRLGLDVTLVNGASEGGDLEIGALVGEGQIDALLYLRDTSIHLSDPHQLLALARVATYTGSRWRPTLPRPAPSSRSSTGSRQASASALPARTGARPSSSSQGGVTCRCTSRNWPKWRPVPASRLRAVNTPLMFA